MLAAQVLSVSNTRFQSPKNQNVPTNHDRLPVSVPSVRVVRFRKLRCVSPNVAGERQLWLCPQWECSDSFCLHRSPVSALQRQSARWQMEGWVLGGQQRWPAHLALWPECQREETGSGQLLQATDSADFWVYFVLDILIQGKCGDRCFKDVLEPQKETSGSFLCVTTSKAQGRRSSR